MTCAFGSPELLFADRALREYICEISFVPDIRDRFTRYADKGIACHDLAFPKAWLLSEQTNALSSMIRLIYGGVVT